MQPPGTTALFGRLVMRVLIDHSMPFLLAHGGVQVQIERTSAALNEVGVETEHLRWWDPKQECDLIHFFGPIDFAYLMQARHRRIPVVLTSFFSQTCNRTSFRLWCEGMIIRAGLATPGARGVKGQLRWQTYSWCAQNIVGLQAERAVLDRVYRIPKDRISVVPLGLSKLLLGAPPAIRSENHLICSGTIAPVKCSVELAQLARAAECPILFVGRPFQENDAYWLRFKTLIDNRWVKYRPHVDDEREMLSLLGAARGFVLLSRFENWSLAAHEAAACGLPLLLRDQKWSRERFGDQANYFPSAGFNTANVETLKRFYSVAPGLPSPRVPLYGWPEIAQRLKTIYESVVARSR